jgi:phosphoglycerate dehydrogenase-like enzyme
VAERLAAFGEVVTIDSIEEQVVAQAAERAVAIVARANVPVTADVFDAAPELRVVGRSGTGTDNVDLGAATARGIPVVITPDAGTDAVAEGALAMLLTLGKRIPLLHALTVAGRWHERDRVEILDIAGSAIGVVGFGRIGRQITRLSSALGASVRVFDPYLTGLADEPAAIRLDSLEELFATCEFVTLHLPLNDETRGLVDGDLLVRCPPGAVLVNASRGGLIRSLDDLVDALDAGRLGGVGLDVYETEPPDVSHRLFKDPRVLATPHILALSRSGRARIYDEMCGGIEAVFNGARPKSIANPQIYNVDGLRHSEGVEGLCR